MAMANCVQCGTRITTLREKRQSFEGTTIEATWIHLADGQDDHIPQPPEPKPRKKRAP